MIDSWGGRLVFVYLPAGERYLPGAEPLRGLRARDAVLGAVASIGIAVVDIVPLFDNDPDPLRFFVARLPLHYTVEGHAVVLGGVLDFLERNLRQASR